MSVAEEWGTLTVDGSAVPLSERWRHVADRSECVAGHVWCERHRRHECGDTHEPVENPGLWHAHDPNGGVTLCKTREYAAIRLDPENVTCEDCLRLLR